MHACLLRTDCCPPSFSFELTLAPSKRSLRMRHTGRTRPRAASKPDRPTCDHATYGACSAECSEQRRASSKDSNQEYEYAQYMEHQIPTPRHSRTSNTFGGTMAAASSLGSSSNWDALQLEHLQKQVGKATCSLCTIRQ